MRFLAGPLLALALAGVPEDAIRETFESAVRALSRNDLAAAQRGFENVLEQRPNHVGALGNLGVVYSRLERFADAVRVYQQALHVAPADPQLNLNLGLAYLKQEAYTSAKPHLKKVLAADPNHLQARELLATAELFTGQVGRATETLEALRPAGGPSVQYLLSIAYLKLGRRDEAREVIAQLFTRLPAGQARLLAGRAYYESTLFDDAVAELETARDLDPALPGVWRELGKTYVSLRRSDDAREALREAIRRDTGDMEARYFLGALLVQEGSAEGVPYLEQVRESRPELWGSYYYLGKAALARSAPAEAARLLRTASKLRPDDTSVLYLLARALTATGQDAEASVVMRRLADVRSRTREREQALVQR
jgi:cytochrome c-type biogenesis protein CcmH/NrfG